MAKKPTVSVVMSVYNAELYVREAIESILQQTYADFEFLILDDGSTDASLEIVRSISDPRIRVFSSDKNMGIVHQVNRGISMAQGKYIARMDADDISLPERFAHEVAYLETHHRVGMVGTWVELIDTKGVSNNVVWRFQATPEDIPVVLLFGNNFANPTVMIRTSALPEVVYKSEYTLSEDFELTTRISDSHGVANLQEVLLKYRVHGKCISHRKRELCRELVMRVLGGRLDRLGVAYTEDDLQFHNAICFEIVVVNESDLHRADVWFKRIYEANLISRKYDKVILFKALLGRWYTLCGLYSGSRLAQIRQVFNSSLFTSSAFTIKDYFRLFGILMKRLFRKKYAYSAPKK